MLFLTSVSIVNWGLQTVADRIVERVDDAIKADIMHWAAFYVSDTRWRQVILLLTALNTGSPDATRQKEDIPPWSMGDQGHEHLQGKGPSDCSWAKDSLFHQHFVYNFDMDEDF